MSDKASQKKSVATKDATKPKKAGDEEKKTMLKKNFESYALYISRVLKSVFQDIGITLPSISIMDSFVRDIFERIATEASSLARNYNKTTITVKEIETATKLILKGDLNKHAVSEGQSAVKRASGKGSTSGSQA
ncbi:histone H2B, putative [Entamoeba dispar SAW760]|uniref:Histone H2B n=1 Tax=Entamoeba dispar (strain ATCC PRA-260 / SAW760) TaxID=370354 RepID=B0E6W2_ENTDS|nr:histone H2B, putative [Entamoeba dispar SAW760]XP_001735546.1 histone H2B, putative [Entamoeba dispar SAW760]EDR28263.1 histone H2B, putative [Entamoeba dispar SAW760]EDR29703.1 histone H2B, putative [Entamoeba dispar SAW760]|eukprot:EDR28263.1 histone H2B, putative [Entamoeba dispar SAW760]